MNYQAEINIMPKQEILDPEGKSIHLGLENLGINKIDEVRIGKHITLQIEASDEEEAKEKVEYACKNLLANLIMENYDYEIKKAE